MTLLQHFLNWCQNGLFPRFGFDPSHLSALARYGLFYPLAPGAAILGGAAVGYMIWKMFTQRPVHPHSPIPSGFIEIVGCALLAFLGSFVLLGPKSLMVILPIFLCYLIPFVYYQAFKKYR
jgi:hypothetical protein